MAFAKFEENRFRLDREIAENHAILVNLTAGRPIVYAKTVNFSSSYALVDGSLESRTTC